MNVSETLVLSRENEHRTKVLLDVIADALTHPARVDPAHRRQGVRLRNSLERVLAVSSAVTATLEQAIAQGRMQPSDELRLNSLELLLGGKIGQALNLPSEVESAVMKFSSAYRLNE